MPSILYYDGYCNMCSRLVRFIYRHGGKAKFQFIPLSQSGMPESSGGGSVILETEGKKWYKSSAVLRVCIILGFPWNLLAPLLLIPASWRNAAYDFVAARRIKWFGARNSCFLPEKDDDGHLK
jgi:predicted DCC family thiol-disulfide oxidoreductase YuxK